jgi:hypothetical protein
MPLGIAASHADYMKGWFAHRDSWSSAVPARDLPGAAPRGRVQFADIANGRPVPAEALRDIDLWTG